MSRSPQPISPPPLALRLHHWAKDCPKGGFQEAAFRIPCKMGNFAPSQTAESQLQEHSEYRWPDQQGGQNVFCSRKYFPHREGRKEAECP